MVSQKPCLFILDVGHGNSAVLMDTNGNTVIDAGPGTSLYLFLKQQGIQVIDVLLISHADEDHIGGLIAILSCEEFTVGMVRVNSDASKGSKLWDDLTYTLDKAHQAGELDFAVSLTVDDSGAFDQGCVRIEILAPSLYVAARGPGSTDREGRTITTNSASAVIRLVKDGEPVAIFASDIDDVGLENLAESQVNAAAPVAVFPHHGAKPRRTDMAAFARRFCQIVDPQNLIFSIGRGQFNTPRPEIVAAVREAVPDVRILCTQLSEHCASDVPSAEPTHLTGKFSRGRQGRKCCAGTVVMLLGTPPLQLLPGLVAHSDFIRRVAPTALCLGPEEG